MYKIIGSDHKEYGPISADQVRQWISEGRADVETRACADGSTEWKPLGAFPEFAASFNAPSSPHPAAPFTPDASVLLPTPGAIKVFGILNIVFGALRLLCLPFTFITLSMARRHMAYNPFTTHWLIFSSVIGMIIGALMLTSGIGLCQMRPWARRLAIYTALFVCALTLLNSFVALSHLPDTGPNPEARKFGAIFGAVIGIALACVYNGLLIFFLSKPDVKRALGETV